MSSLSPQDRKSLCRFTFADGRQCRSLRSADHPDFCFDHARKDSQASAADQLARELSYFFSGEYVSAGDLSAALGRLFSAVVRGDIKPRAARTLAYLAQTLVQAIHLSQHEYINAFGTDSWRRAVSNSVHQNFDHRQPAPPPHPSPDRPPVVAGLETGAVGSSPSARPGSTGKTGDVRSSQSSPTPTVGIGFNSTTAPTIGCCLATIPTAGHGTRTRPNHKANRATCPTTALAAHSFTSHRSPIRPAASGRSQRLATCSVPRR